MAHGPTTTGGKTMTAQRIVVRALEQLVRIWTDFWFLADLRNRMLRKAGKTPLFSQDESVPPTSDFRKSLLGLHGTLRAESLRPEETTVAADDINSLFGPPASLPLSWLNKNMAHLPTSLICWTLHSRRLYQLSAELQGLLRATSLNDVCWGDVHWPFRSFAIAVEQPIPDPRDSSRGIDFLLVYQYLDFFAEPGSVPADDAPEEPLLSIRCFNSGTLNAYEPLTQAKQGELLSLLRHPHGSAQRKLQAQWQALDAANLHAVQRDTALTVRLSADHGVPVREFVQAAHEREVAAGRAARSEGDLSLYDQIARLAVGFALYLQVLPSGSPHVSAPRRLSSVGAGPDRLAVLDEADVCTVASMHSLTREELVMLGVIAGEPGERARYQVSCHYREGYWRRPRGQGRIPGAPKTEQVRPTIVRRDRLPEGGAPGGSTKNV
jgi:hypothetical protein